MSRRGYPFNWRGLTAVLLVVGVFAVLVILEVTAAIKGPTRELTDTEISALSVVLGAALGAVATYLGSGTRNGYHPPGADARPRRTSMMPVPDPVPGGQTPEPGELEQDHPDLTPDEFEDPERDPADPDDTEPETTGEFDGSDPGVAP